MFFYSTVPAANSLAHPQASKPGIEGQHLTKVDRSDEIVPLKKGDREVAQAISKARQAMVPKCSQKDLATKVNAKLSDISDFENIRAIPDNKMAAKLERILKVHLRGPNVGQVIDPPKKGEETKKSGK